MLAVELLGTSVAELSEGKLWNDGSSAEAVEVVGVEAGVPFNVFSELCMPLC